jgi:glutaconate CoA-transferase subunit A
MCQAPVDWAASTVAAVDDAAKVIDFPSAAALVTDGSTLGLGGLMMSGAPMSFCRELIRAGRRELELVVMTGGMNVDWLVAAGCVRRLLTAIVSFEGHGLAPSFRRAAERGDIVVEDWSELTMLSAWRAATFNVPYMPTRAGVGSDLVARLPERMGEMTDERSGQPFTACAPLAPDVAVVHAHEADVLGNARFDSKLTWIDGELAKAAQTVIVTAERIVDTATFREAPERTAIPAYAVDFVVHAPRGAWPTAMLPDYQHDADYFRSYTQAARDPATFEAFFAETVR